MSIISHVATIYHTILPHTAEYYYRIECPVQLKFVTKFLKTFHLQTSEIIRIFDLAPLWLYITCPPDLFLIILVIKIILSRFTAIFT